MARTVAVVIKAIDTFSVATTLLLYNLALEPRVDYHNAIVSTMEITPLHSIAALADKVSLVVFNSIKKSFSHIIFDTRWFKNEYLWTRPSQPYLPKAGS